MQELTHVLWRMAEYATNRGQHDFPDYGVSF